MPIKKYGKKFPDDWHPLLIELWSWANYRKFKSPEVERWEHLRNASFVYMPSMMDAWNPWLEEMCRAYASHSYIAALGCESSTKTHTFHTLGFLDYMSSPRDTQMICTTTSLEALKTRMWPVIAMMYRGNRDFTVDWVMRISPHHVILSDKNDPKHSIRAVPIQKKADESEMVDNIIGKHTRRVIWIVDESTDAPKSVIDSAWANLAAGAIHTRLVFLGNPDDQFDALGQYARPVDGWDSVDEDSTSWKFRYAGEEGIALHFNGKKSPNLSYPARSDGSSHWPFMYGHKNLATHLALKETNPLDYYRFCLGWYAEASIAGKIMSSSEIDAAGSRMKATFYGGHIIFFSLDPAFGGDRAILKVWKMGQEVGSEKQIMEQVECVEIPIPPKGMPGEAIGKFVLNKRKFYNCNIIGIDTSTNNSAPAEYIKLNSDMEVVEVDFGGACSDDPVSPTDKTPCKEKYDRKVTELWFTVKSLLPQIRGLDADTCVELTSRRFERKGKPEKMYIETKKEMKKRMGGKSPDKADCVAIGVQVFKKLGGFDLPKSKHQSNGWKRAINKRNGIYSSATAYGG